MRSSSRRDKLRIGGYVLFAAALAMLLLPLQWLVAMVSAAVFHELCHYWAVRCCGGRVTSIRIGACGARMEASGLTSGKELLCALAGPFGGFCLLGTVRWSPRIALCGALQSMFNLLPVYPLDGGRALRCALELLLPIGVCDRVMMVVEATCLIGIGALGVYGCFFLRLGPLPLTVAAVAIFRWTSGKIPCKVGIEPVQ